MTKGLVALAAEVVELLTAMAKRSIRGVGVDYR